MEKLHVMCFLIGCFCWVAHVGKAANNLTKLSVYNATVLVKTRLAQTTLAMEFQNNDNCSKSFGFTLQLPRNARLTSLQMDLSDGCTLTSQVKDLEQATDDFENQAAQGKPAALITAFDVSNFQLQVSLPPVGSTVVELHYEEVLLQRLHNVPFQVPLYAGIDVEKLYMNVVVEDPTSMVQGLEVEGLEGKTVKTSTFQDPVTSIVATFEESDVTGSSGIPRFIRAYFEPGPLPPEGFLMSDGACFTHLFHPSTYLESTGPLAKRIVFVIDVSGSMHGQKLADAKAAFVAMIQTLDESDTLLVQTFSDKGTEDLWGPQRATGDAKASAARFVRNLATISSTNLNDAYLDGIKNVYETEQGEVAILVILTDGQGNTGGQATARGVRQANEGGKVKIYGLAFGYDADIDLLRGISILNGGRTIRIYEGFGDAVTQMETFYREELGIVLLSDIVANYESDAYGLTETTIKEFPVLPEGGEIVVRGKLQSLLATEDTGSHPLRTLVSAVSALGRETWSTDHPIELSDSRLGECHQSYAQARITELLDYRDAERALGDELFVSGNIPRLDFEGKAQRMALDAGLVWPGLTAMVTVENDSCSSTYDVCFDGDSSTSDDAFGDAEPFVMPNRGSGGFTTFFMTVLCLVLAFVITAMHWELV